MLKMNLRIKLTEFMNTDREEEIVKLINDCYNKLKYPFVLKLWYDVGDFKPEEIIEFSKKWKSTWKDKYKTYINSSPEVNINDFIWFDVTTEHTLSPNYKYRHMYFQKPGNVDSLIAGINSFYTMAEFTLSPKPAKKTQKRNDGE